MSAEDADVGWDSITKLDLHDVSTHQLFSIHVELLTFADHDRKLCANTTPPPAALRTIPVLGKNIWGAWPLIIWEATTAKRNYYRTNYINH